MSIVIGADIVPTESNTAYFTSGNMEPILGYELISLIKKYDYRVFNLEAPLFNFSSPIKKYGAILKADETTINGIKKLGVDLLTIANNHIMDHGEKGLFSTLQILKNRNIGFVGASNNLAEATKPFLVNVRQKKIGFYACVEHEFSVALKDKPGANPFDALESYDHVVSLKSKCDYVIVLYHGGKEHFRYPSPMLQRVCRKFIEKGADLVVCQHSHCIGCDEKYLSGTIVYGQGNFLFNDCKGPFVQESLLIEIDDDFNIKYQPIIKYKNGTRIANELESKKILLEFQKRSEEIRKKNFIEDIYKIHSKKMLKNYLQYCSGYEHKYFLRILNKICNNRLTNYFVNRYQKHELLAIRNCIECEAHRELFIEGLKNI